MYLDTEVVKNMFEEVETPREELSDLHCNKIFQETRRFCKYLGEVLQQNHPVRKNRGFRGKKSSAETMNYVRAVISPYASYSRDLVYLFDSVITMDEGTLAIIRLYVDVLMKLMILLVQLTLDDIIAFEVM